MSHRALTATLVSSVLASLTVLGVTTPAPAAPAPGETAADQQRVVVPARAADPVLPDRFQEEVVLGGLDQPTAVDFGPAGEIFVADKAGVVRVWESPEAQPVQVVDLSTEVHNLYDRGLLGLAVDPGFPERPYLYVLYAYDHVLGSAEPAPRWGVPGVSYDDCPDPEDGGPGAEDMGCVASGRLSRLTLAKVPGGWRASGEKRVMLEGWCMQYPSHATGSLHVGPDGHLWASGGEGAHYLEVDRGQLGAPYWPGGNPCGDPAREGGSLRAQDVRTTGDPTGLSGAVVRIDLETGEGVPGNPFAGRAEENARRIVAYGMRNPFRFAFRPGTGGTDPEVYVGDVGQGGWEEINRLRPGGPAENFGWPCFEGPDRNAGFDPLDLPLCESLYRDGSAAQPFYAYPRTGAIAGESCPTGSASISGLQFGASASYPSAYRGALFFSDYSRQCIWVMGKRADGSPDPRSVRPFLEGAASPVELLTGPEGDLYYLSLGVDAQGYPAAGAGSLRRVRYVAGNRPPEARIESRTPVWGPSPLDVVLDASVSTDAEDDILGYRWDLDGDGEFDDADSPEVYTTVTGAEDVTVRVRVTDGNGGEDIGAIVLHPGDAGPPVLDIASPARDLRWAVGDRIPLAATATDPDGTEPTVTWSVALAHCPNDVCHTHPLQTAVPGDTLVRAPDHEHPSYLLVSATATDGRGLSTTESFRLDPRTVRLRFRTKPGGLPLSIAGVRRAKTWTGTFIVGSRVTVTAPKRHRRDRARFVFKRWSDGGRRTHTYVAPARPATLTAVYRRQKK
ncbi:PQQ-dependent sugar dehydrogenase [Nocardioides marmotae]|uniref:PQQ-dependent sugar dehydrogenase n=1 Tax=Nocardioides marmotae TaxID=2663857 RepID=UPI0012B52C62|nr:PQQ-dependent sugar dehydrogenase [Nocardioides marmotae]MBC9732555.1 PQQ-dependent sugar dehydrogenase [Nocardioides marmotae]MTB83674.1 sugar dehydrogenase [Nocardioides marmotae]